MNHWKNRTICVLIIFLFSLHTLYAEDIVWHEKKEDVFNLAKKDNKHIFLLVGDSTGANCRKVMDNLQNASLNKNITKNYILWYSLYSDAERKAEVNNYTKEYDEAKSSYPFLYVIHPEKPDEAVASAHGVQSVEELRKMLSYTLTPREGLKWHDNQEEVFKLAKEQNKYIFMLVGRPSCGNCKRVISHLNDENAPLKQIIEDNYILWYCLNDDPVIRTEIRSYTAEFDDVATYLPFLYVINPEKPGESVSSKWDYQDIESLKEMLSVYLVGNENIADRSENKVTLSENKLYISNPNESEDIYVYTIAGKQIYSVHKNECEITIDTSGFPKGILIIHSSKGWSSKIINR